MAIAEQVRFYWRVWDLMRRGEVISPDMIREDYDRLSVSYDAYFSSQVAKHSRQLVAELPVPGGARVLDLACGTGTLSLALAERAGPNGSVVSVDQSRGMLAQAEQKARDAGLAATIRFVESDMLDATGHFDNETFDVVTCGWAIGYTKPVSLLREARRILKPGGIVGLIENRRNTLRPVRDAAKHVAQALPNDVEHIMDLHSRLPRSRRTLRRWFDRAGLNTARVWEGEEAFTFPRGEEVLKWVLHTGASAGFDQMMSASSKKERDRLFVEYIERRHRGRKGITVSHLYTAGWARKGEPCT